MSLSLLWPVLAAACAALTVQQVLGLFTAPGRGAARVLTDFAGDGPTTTTTAPLVVGSTQHKLRVFFRAWGVDAVGRETSLLLFTRLGAAIGLALLIRLIGFPWLTMLVGVIVGWLGVSALVSATWNKQRFELERELPVFLSRLASVVHAVPNVIQAVAEVVETLDEKGPLRAWCVQLVTRLQAEGRPALDDLLGEAHTLSPALGLTVFELKRLAETGGSGYAEAFGLAAESLSHVLEARAIAASKGDGARGAIRTIILALIGVTALMVTSPQVNQSFAEPMIQLAYVVIAGMVGSGYWLMNSMIEEAMS